jgi:hypothetical protein
MMGAAEFQFMAIAMVPAAAASAAVVSLGGGLAGVWAGFAALSVTRAASLGWRAHALWRGGAAAGEKKTQ